MPCEDGLQKAFAAARASQAQEFTAVQQRAADEHIGPSLRQARNYSAADIDAWLAKTKLEKDKFGKPRWKDAQIEALQVICKRMCIELQETDAEVPLTDPLLWVVHGTPGTGKSEVLKLVKKLFHDVCGWQMGLEYQMVALQAVMAQLLGGDTIHHALGINPFGVAPGEKAAQRAAQRQATVAERVMQWRWLFIDEISMVSAKLLAEVDMKLRAIISDVNNMKKTAPGDVLHLGGLSVMINGNFWQLDPPRGGFLAAIPAEFIRA